MSNIFFSKNKKNIKIDLCKYVIMYYFPSHIMNQRTLYAKRILTAHLAFGARIVEG